MAEWGKILSRGTVVDRRGMAPAAIGGGLGITGAVIMLLFNLLSGGNINVSDVLSQLESVQVERTQNPNAAQFEGEDDYEVFASKVLGSNNEMWEKVFVRNNRNYTEPKLVLFRQATNSACGGASSEVGPHYCPLDKTIYLDETFFDELTRRFGAQGGDVAEAYVIAHEVAHHAQNELGIMDQVQKAGKDNELSIALELQADCFAGLWANSIKELNVISPGEIREAIDAAEAVGDDRIQKSVNGQVNPETWTHGSSAQRAEWFNRGYEQGSVQACNTFR